MDPRPKTKGLGFRPRVHCFCYLFFCSGLGWSPIRWDLVRAARLPKWSAANAAVLAWYPKKYYGAQGPVIRKTHKSMGLSKMREHVNVDVTYNPGQKLLGRLRASLHFTPNSIILTIGWTIRERACSLLLWPPLPHIQCWKKSHHFVWCKIQHW